MSQTIPMRFRILHLISQNPGITEAELMDALRPEYGGEGQLKQSIIYTHLASMRAVGMIEDTEISVDKNNKLIQRVKITEYGTSRLAYLPKNWAPKAV